MPLSEIVLIESIGSIEPEVLQVEFDGSGLALLKTKTRLMICLLETKTTWFSDPVLSCAKSRFKILYPDWNKRSGAF